MACLRLARSGCLRLGECTVPAQGKFRPEIHARLQDVVLLHSSALGYFLKLHLPWDKTHRAIGRDVVVPEEHPDADPVSFFFSRHVPFNNVQAHESLFSFTGRSGKRSHLTKTAFVARLNACLSVAGLQPIHGHSIRAGGATQLLLWGFDPVVVQARGGWASTESFLKYWRELTDILAVHSNMQLAVFRPALGSAITDGPGLTAKPVSIGYQAGLSIGHRLRGDSTPVPASPFRLAEAPQDQ